MWRTTIVTQHRCMSYYNSYAMWARYTTYTMRTKDTTAEHTIVAPTKGCFTTAENSAPHIATCGWTFLALITCHCKIPMHRILPSSNLPMQNLPMHKMTTQVINAKNKKWFLEPPLLQCNKHEAYQPNIEKLTTREIICVKVHKNPANHSWWATMFRLNTN